MSPARRRSTVKRAASPGTAGVGAIGPPPLVPPGGGPAPSTSGEPSPPAPPAAFAAAIAPLPRLSEFLALLHHETQSVIEYLALPDVHAIAADRPSEGLVKIERMRLEIPVRLLAQIVAISKEDIDKLPVLAKPLPIPERPGSALVMWAEILSPKAEQTTQREGTLVVEFSVAAK